MHIRGLYRFVTEVRKRFVGVITVQLVGKAGVVRVLEVPGPRDERIELPRQQRPGSLVAEGRGPPSAGAYIRHQLGAWGARVRNPAEIAPSQPLPAHRPVPHLQAK
eukprot:1262268-Pyramimonas_sp.AAC.1